jgi:hypothetical protein
MISVAADGAEVAVAEPIFQFDAVFQAEVVPTQS